MTDTKTESDTKNPKTQIQLALIGLIGTIAGIAGTLGVAVIGNWNEIFTNQSEPSDEIEEKNQIISEQKDKISKLENQLEEMNKDIAMNPTAAISFLPYALRAIGATDGTIDCATPFSDALKDLACQQIQTLLNSVDNTYELTQERADVRPQVTRYQSENGLSMGKDPRKAGMLDEQTLKFLMQERLRDVGSDKPVDHYFP